MKKMPEAAMVLAAGLGTRMRPLTDHLPKPLIQVAGKALIDYALDRFAGAGVQRAIVNVHYRADQIEDRLAQRKAPQIIISDERALLLETGGGLKKARRQLGEAPVFCTNTDAILIDDNGFEACNTLAAAWSETAMDALLLLAPIENASGYDGQGDFHLGADGQISRRVSVRTEGRAPFVFTGLQIISPQLLDETPEGPFSTNLLWNKAAANGRLCGAVHRGYWMHVGDMAGLKSADARLAR